MYLNELGKEVIVPIKMTGARGADFTAAFDKAKIPKRMRKEIRKNYTWHHYDDFDPTTGECTMQLVLRKAHQATYPHKGFVAQYEKFHGVKYKN